MSTATPKTEDNVTNYVGARPSKKRFKAFLGNAKTPEERAALKALYLGAPLKFVPKPKVREQANVVDAALARTAALKE